MLAILLAAKASAAVGFYISGTAPHPTLV